MSFAALDVGHLAAKYVCKALFASPCATFEVIDTLPLSKANLVDHEYAELGPLAPLYNLIAPNPPR